MMCTTNDRSRRARAVTLALLLALLALPSHATARASAGRATASKAKARTRKPARAPVRPADPAAETRGLVWHVETFDGDLVDSRQGDEPINPASVTKVATTLWALERLGPDHRFETRFLTDGPAEPRGGELLGNLLVAGGGDPDFQIESAMLVARGLNDLGIHRVRGGLFVNPRFWTGWEGGSLGRDPDPQRRALLMATRLRQALDPARWTGSMRRTWVDLAARRGFNPGTPPRVVVAGFVDGRESVDGTPLLVHRARPLVQTLRRLNAYSNNDIERVGESLGTPYEMGRFLAARLGVPERSIQFETTSGLGENRITPKQVVAMFRELHRTCERMGLPIASVLPAAGCDPGTVAHFFHRMSNGPAATSVVGKTGTLTATDGGVSVFAGIASTGRGDLIFCVARPRAAGRLGQARWQEEEWVLDLVANHGGPVGRTCAAPLTGPDDGAVVEALDPLRAAGPREAQPVPAALERPEPPVPAQPAAEPPALAPPAPLGEARQHGV